MTDQLPVVKVSTLNFGETKATKGLITPEVAAQLLERNFENNRNISTPYVRRYSRLMKDGQWKISEPLLFSKDGTLIDGQHRLNAVIDAGVSAPFLIVTGNEKSACEVLNQGKKRDVLNVLQFRGKKISPHYVSSIRMAIMIGDKTRNVRYSPSEVATLVEHFEDGLQFAWQHSRTSTALKYAPVVTVVLMAYYEENHQRLDDFLYCWHNGTVRYGAEDNAAILLRNNYLTKHLKESVGSGNSGRMSFFNRTQSALTYFLKGECPKHFREIDRLVWGENIFNAQSIKSILDNAK